MPFRAGLAVLAIATGACRAPRPCAAVPSTTVQPAPRRDHCLAPPWVLDPARPASGVPGWSAAVCRDGPGSFLDAADRARRSAYFVHGGMRRISESEFKTVQLAVMAVPGLRASVGLGGCCSPKVAKETNAFCVKVWLNDVCNVPLSRLVQAADEALRLQGLEKVRVGLDVMVDGTVGPRCEVSDPRCGPLTWRDQNWMLTAPSRPAGCAAGRVRTAALNQVTPGLGCVQDGDCLIGACGEKCLRWDQSLGSPMCPDRGRIEEEEPSYCGCVSGRCDWFRPAAQ
jgi:hypothetical protein